MLIKSLDYSPEYNDVNLTCTFEEDTNFFVLWSLNYRYAGQISAECEDKGTPEVNSSLYAYACAQNYFTLTVKHVTRSNNGDIWQCIVYSQAGDYLRSNQVEIYIKGTSLLSTQVLLTKSSDIALVNESATLTCKFHGANITDIVWSHRGSSGYYFSTECDSNHDMEKIDLSLYSYVCKENVFMWIIRRVTEKHDGEIWKCIICSIKGVCLESNEVQLHVQC